MFETEQRTWEQRLLGNRSGRMSRQRRVVVRVGGDWNERVPLHHLPQLSSDACVQVSTRCPAGVYQGGVLPNGHAEKTRRHGGRVT